MPSAPKDRALRRWAPNRSATGLLGRSARHLARAAAKKLAGPDGAECIAKYRFVSAVERKAKLLKGDLLVELLDGHAVRAIDVARETNERPSDVCEMYAVAKAFPPHRRPRAAQYNHLLLAMRMVRKFSELGLRPLDAYVEIRRVGLSQHRDVTRHFATLARDSGATRLSTAPAGSCLLNRAHMLPFQALLTRMPDGSVQVLACDPPYVFGAAGYRSRSARSRAGDNDDPERAVSLVIDLLRDWQPKLASGGVLLLWQPWQALLTPIAEAIRKHEWSVVGPVIWDKGRPQPGRFDSPYSVQGEMLWVLHRPGDTLINHDGSSREMILLFPPLSSPSWAHRQQHCFEKPVDLCRHLVRKHSRPGDLVIDACGCTGSMSVAAIETGRQWVYAESNPENFRLGQGRVAEALGRSRVRAS